MTTIGSQLNEFKLFLALLLVKGADDAAACFPMRDVSDLHLVSEQTVEPKVTRSEEGAVDAPPTELTPAKRRVTYTDAVDGAFWRESDEAMDAA